MTKKIDEVAAGKGRRITLKLSNTLTNDPCAICGGRCDPGGFDYFAKGTQRLVCDPCAEKYAPEMVAIRKAALAYAEREAEAMVELIGDRVKNAIKEPLEERIMRAISEVKGDDVPF